MSYSRRQLYAMGEPLGECVTRKEGGRVIYGGGGGSSSTQTSISDLPDWAKPTAQNILGAAEGTVFKKDKDNKVIGLQDYVPYTGQRTAQFTPLQQQAYSGAYNLNAGPEAFSEQVGQYMSPYQQNVIDREKMEAARASQMLGQQQQAQATQAGAFGGYREGIQRAERERGLRSQMQDIQTRGSQAAYDRAADQFRSGITQQLAVGQQQAQLGTQQQQTVQQMLDQQYQDFINQRKYPMQQIGYLSDILRGTPMGGTQTMYASPGSILGQLGGIGMGLYGMSKMAEGGVTSDQNVEGILSKLSVDQLKQSRQIAVANGDDARVRMIDEELAQRSSEESGLSSAYNQLPAGTQEDMVSAAGGGIVAFADGGTDYGDPMGTGAAEMTDTPRQAYGTTGLQKLIQRYTNTPEWKIKAMDEAAKAEVSKPEAPKAEAPKAEAPRRAAAAPARADEPKAAKVSPSLMPALQALSEKTGEPMDSLMANLTRLENHFATQRSADIKGLADIVSAQMGESKKLKEQALPAAMAEFGFKWAQAASKPGARFLGSAAEASPVISQVSAEYQKAAREADRADMQLKLTLKQFEIAQRNGDQRTAMTLANQAEVLKANRDRLNLMKQQIAQTGAIAQARLAQQESQFGRTVGLKQQALGVQGLTAAAQLARVRQAAMKDWEAGPAPRLQRQLSQQYGKNWQSIPEAQRTYNSAKSEYMGNATAASNAKPVSALLSSEDLSELGLSQPDED